MYTSKIKSFKLNLSIYIILKGDKVTNFKEVYRRIEHQTQAQISATRNGDDGDSFATSPEKA